MKDTIQQLIDSVDKFEGEGLPDQAIASRQSLVNAMGVASNEAFSRAIEFLCAEKITIRGVEAAPRWQAFYLRLHSMARARLGADTVALARIKRKIAQTYIVQNWVEDAVGQVEQALAIFLTHLGKYSDDTIEAISTLQWWKRGLGGNHAEEFNNWVWREYPICEHLQPVVKYAMQPGVKAAHDLGRGGRVHIRLDAWMDIKAIHLKLELGDCVEKLDVEDMRSESWYRGFRCAVHKHVIEGNDDPSDDRRIIT